MASQNQVAELHRVRNQLESSCRDSKERLKELVDELSNLKQKAKDCLRKHDREGAIRYLYRMRGVRKQADLVVLVINKQRSIISEIDAKLDRA
ncbi:Chromosome segregation ATPase [Giardia duodenalis]|uniref:ATP-dependent Clp protease ATP-binding subunit ClpB n=2 Tax=Giardia intestinalis TaxID=5741 RepID=C6LSY7_GIAIB|nr:ATP-dependent Clp protease ATP-binding subunit ClpB [Giardia intestinalis ATCC 50581]ESU41552.1 Chromosome segregation ATPase [Giardia intestinalis]